MTALLRRSVFMLACVLLLVPRWAQATALTFSSSAIEDKSFNFFENNGTSSSALTVGADTAGSFLNVATGSAGASLFIPTAVTFARTSTEHDDDWFCDTPTHTGCLALTSPVSALLTIAFDAVISPGISEMSLELLYTTSSGQRLVMGVSEDPTFSAGGNFSAGGTSIDIPFDVQIDNLGFRHVSAHLATPVSFGLPAFCGLNCVSPMFSDVQQISLELEGAGSVDASHTFSVTLTSLDPNVILTSADGRTGGTAAGPSAVPEPGSLLLMATGLVGLSRVLRLRRV